MKLKCFGYIDIGSLDIFIVSHHLAWEYLTVPLVRLISDIMYHVIPDYGLD